MNLAYMAKMKVRKRKEGELRILITTISGRQVLFYTPDDSTTNRMFSLALSGARDDMYHR